MKAVKSARQPGTRRHKWVKVRLHVYICRQCGCGSVNAQGAKGEWFTTYHKPDGSSEVARHVPACEPGAFTAAYLKRYESAIACAVSSQAQASKAAEAHSAPVTL